jgi:hypothetical protein
MHFNPNKFTLLPKLTGGVEKAKDFQVFEN